MTRQGEHGDTFHVLVHGTAQVDVDGREVRRLEQGAYFGELALLRDSRRTATITMLSDGETAFVGRRAFLDALSFGGGTAGALSAMSTGYVMPAVDPS